MIEWGMIGCMAVGGVLFAVGGTGFRWMRRYLMPVLFGVITTLCGHPVLRCAAMSALMSIALHMGYGDKVPYWRKLLTAALWVAPVLIVGFAAFAFTLLTPLLFVTLFALSNWKPTSAIFRWKIVEFITGVMIGVTVASVL